MGPQPFIDLRSDTVTRPTDQMRRAMARAEVGDDVFGEDPTVRRLEEMGAARVGAQAALFVPTGTMGNQIALHVLARAGTEVVLEARSHIFNYEKGAMAVLSGLLPRPIEAHGGVMTPGQVEAALSPDDVVHTPTGLIALENTHNMTGGKVMAVNCGRDIQAVARRRGVPVHLDGARLFNAAAALGRPASELAEGFDSVMFCLSKGLGAPAGSLLCGSESFVAESRKVRKLLGGGMRQAGVLAAPGIVALEQMVDRLEEDHKLAREIADGLSGVAGVELASPPETNILIFRVTSPIHDSGTRRDASAEAFVARLRERGVLALTVGQDLVRMVTHFDLPAGARDRTVRATREAAMGL